jgi:hypothetical protein
MPLTTSGSGLYLFFITYFSYPQWSNVQYGRSRSTQHGIVWKTVGDNTFIYNHLVFELPRPTFPSSASHPVVNLHRSPIAGTDVDFSSSSNSPAVIESTDLPSFRTIIKISPAVAPELAMKRRPLESKATPVGRMQPGQSAALILSFLGGTGALGRLADDKIGITAVLLVFGCVGLPFAKVIAKSLYPSGGLRFLLHD